MMAQIGSRNIYRINTQFSLRDNRPCIVGMREICCRKPATFWFEVNWHGWGTAIRDILGGRDWRGLRGCWSFLRNLLNLGLLPAHWPWRLNIFKYQPKFVIWYFFGSKLLADSQLCINLGWFLSPRLKSGQNWIRKL
jgi:hypothetical protein